MVLAPSTLRILEELDCLDAVLKQGFKLHRVDCFGDGQVRGSVEIDQLNIEHPYALSVPQSVLENVLEDALASRYRPVLWNHRATELSQESERVRVSVDRMAQRMMGYAVMHEELLVDKSFPFAARWLLAADGYDSLIRRLLHIPYEQVGPSRAYVLMEHETGGPHDSVMRVHLNQGLLNSWVPLSNTRARYAMELCGMRLESSYRYKDRMPLQGEPAFSAHLQDDALDGMIRERIPWTVLPVERIHWRSVLPFEMRLADEFLHERVLLVGDAARSGNPLGVWGLNYGFEEVERYARALGVAMHHANSDGDAQLAELAELTRKEWIDRLRISIRQEDGGADWMSHHWGQIMTTIPVTQKHLEMIMRELGIHEVTTSGEA